MIHIKHFKVHTENYIGEINLDIDTPQVRVLLSSDTAFLDHAMNEIQQRVFYTDQTLQISSTNLSPNAGRNSLYFIQKQENVIEGLSAKDNIFLKSQNGFVYSPSKAEKYCKELFRKFGFIIPLDVSAACLTVSQRRFIEIYRAYLHCPQLLIANEITAGLSYLEMVCLNRVFADLTEQGTTIICLSTRWEDATKIADSITVYVEGNQKRTFSREEALHDPQSLYTLMNDMRTEWQYENERDDQRKWMKVVAESALIEDRRNRANMILRAYCDRICTLVNAAFCRIYLYRLQNDSVTYVNSSTNDNLEFGAVREDSIRTICVTMPVFFSSSLNSAHKELFTSDENPKAIMCYTTKIDKSSFLFLEIGHMRYWLATEDEVDQIRFTANEMCVFIENNQLRSQSVYLQESNHRIKNNMQMILNFLMLQRQSLLQQLSLYEDRQMVDIGLSDLINRVMAVYHVHNAIACEDLFNNDVDLLNILHELASFYGDSLEVKTHINIPSMPKPILLPACIMLNELMNNSVKHNAHLHRRILVKLEMLQDDDNVILSYSDDGGDVPKETVKETTSSGIGMRLISLVVETDLKGKLHIEAQNGYHVQVVFPLSVLEQTASGESDY